MIELREVDLETERAELDEMEEEIFSTDRFESWDGYTVFWILAEAQKVGSIAFAPDMTLGTSWDSDDESPGTLWLVSVGILPKFQKQGIGTKAVRLLLEKANRMGFTCVTSNYRVSNDASRRLHETCGFKRVMIMPRYYPNPIEDAEVVETIL